MIRIGFLGPKGTFSELAALGYLQRRGIDLSDVEQVPAKSIAALFEMVQDSYDLVFVPVENSIEGPVLITQDLLVATPNVQIEEEFSIPIVNQLLVLPGVDWSQITDVISHPQPIGQCRQFFENNFSIVPKFHFSDSTATAAGFVADGKPIVKGVDPQKTAAIGSDRLAELYGLEIAQSSIQDSITNRTRFWVLSRSRSAPTGNDKTTIIFSTFRDRPGGLVDILGELSRRGINLTSISSRPTKAVLGEYLFFVDLLGHCDDPDVKSALDSVGQKASFFKLVGSYRVSEES